jgi:mono/diheme cytochrome c family protein
MRRTVVVHRLRSGALAVLAVATTATIAFAQYTQNREPVPLDTSKYSAAAQPGLRLFKVKCSGCHNLDLSMKASLLADKSTPEVRRMQAMASSHFNDQEATTIATFLAEAGRLRPANTVAGIPADSVAQGRAVYFAQGCDACHAIGGRGGDGGPKLDGVGKRLSPKDILRSLREPKGDSVMPQLPAGVSEAEVTALVNFLSTLREE